MKKKSGFLGLFLICFLLVNSTYAKVGNTVIIGSNTIIGSSNPTNEWVKLTSTITAPTGTTRMRVLLSNDATCGSLGIFDDIYVTFSTVFDPRAGFPTPSVTGNSSVCQGTTTSLTGSTTTGAATWVSSNTDVATVSATGVVTGVSAGTATITYTVTEGNCTASATKAMTVNAQPSAPVTTFNNQFHGCKSVVPKAHTANSDPIFEWRDASGNILPSTMIDGGINSILSNPVTTSQTVYVFEQSANGCYSPATAVELIVYPLPAKNFTIEGTTFSCGTPITLTVNPPNTTANQAVEYWSNGSADGAFYGSGNSIVFSPTPPATSLSQSVFAFLRETHILPVNPITNQPDILKCYSENENISINIKPLPATPSVTNVTYCQNAIAAQLTAGTAGADLRWYTQATGSFPMCSQPPPPVDCPAPTPSTTEAGTTSYFVTQIVDGCESSPRAELTVIVNEPEPNPITCPENITVTAACDATTAVATWTAPTATASCGTEIPSLSSNYNSGDEFSVGTTVTYTATLGTDNRGYTATLGNETATCSFTVTVNAASVATPVLTACPENIIVLACGEQAVNMDCPNCNGVGYRNPLKNYWG
ncbi:MAG: HYR domain-containing protein [Saprospiraceae bacterium]|nr:HYR domain-containing protein [Saprospiraceae bacterium]